MQEERDGELMNLRLSPDQTRVAMARTINDNTDIWTYEIASRRWSKLTSNPGAEVSLSGLRTAAIWRTQRPRRITSDLPHGREWRRSGAATDGRSEREASRGLGPRMGDP